MGFAPFGFYKDKSSGPTLEDLLGVIDQYTYKPQYTGQTEKGLFDLFQSLTGEGGGGVNAIPFDIGLPTTGLYDSLTRGIKQDYLGTPGGPEGGRIADIRAYYNNLGIPESAINQERLANQDLNNSLLDSAAKINESQKDRLTNILNIGAGVGGNLYGQNLAQHRANAGLGLSAVGQDLGLQESIRQANQQSLNDLLGGAGGPIGAVIGASVGGPGGATLGYNIGSNIGGSNPNAPSNVSRNTSNYNPFSFFGNNNNSNAKLIGGK